MAVAEWPRYALLAGRRLARPVRVRCSTRYTTGRRDAQDQSGGANAKHGAATTFRHFGRPDLSYVPRKKNLEDFCHVLGHEWVTKRPETAVNRWGGPKNAFLGNRHSFFRKQENFLRKTKYVRTAATRSRPSTWRVGRRTSRPRAAANAECRELDQPPAVGCPASTEKGTPAQMGDNIQPDI